MLSLQALQFYLLNPYLYAMKVSVHLYFIVVHHVIRLITITLDHATIFILQSNFSD